jgi:transcriptional regulator with XRE-family HTH domain
MITNERQHRITKAEIRRFEQAIAQAEQEEAPTGVDPRLQVAMIEGLRSQLADLVEEVERYEALRAGKVKRRVLTSLLDFPAALIEARIVRQLTQKELGKRLQLAEQQIQRYESTRYAGASLERLQEVADALGVTVKKSIDFAVPATASGGERREAGTTAAGREWRQRRTTATASDRTASSSLSSKRGRATKKGSERMGGKKTGKAAASAAGKTLASKSASKTAKRAAASDLAQVGNRKVTGKKAASSAGKTLASKSASKTAKKAAASDLSQARQKKR